MGSIQVMQQCCSYTALQSWCRSQLSRLDAACRLELGSSWVAGAERDPAAGDALCWPGPHCGRQLPIHLYHRPVLPLHVVRLPGAHLTACHVPALTCAWSLGSVVD